jgi:hypothetical protein
MRSRSILAVVTPFLLVLLGAATAGATLADPGDGPLGGLDSEQQQRLLRLIRALGDGNGPRRGVDRFSP